jgi:transposase
MTFKRKGQKMKKYVVTLTEDEQEDLTGITSKGKHRSQKVINSLILLGCDEGEYQKKRSKNKEIARILNISMKRIDRVKKRFVEEGLDIALEGRKSSRIYKKVTDGDFEAHLVALSCSEPPGGFSRWSLRLLADKVVELEYIDNVSHETIRRVLKKMKLNLGSAKDG